MSRATPICLRFSLDFFYGIDANQFAANSALANESGRSTQPDYQVANRQNLGYSGQVTLNIPVWNWGVTRSKIKQAELKEAQAKIDLSLARAHAAKQHRLRLPPKRAPPRRSSIRCAARCNSR